MTPRSKAWACISRRRQRDDDGGWVLIMVLAFMIVFGLISAGLLAQSEGGLKNTVVLRASDSKVYSADSGIEYGVESILTDPTICADSSPTPTLTNTYNGQTVRVSFVCQETSSSNGGFGWAVVARHNFSTSNGSNKPVNIGGPTYVGNQLDLKKDLVIENGDLRRNCLVAIAGNGSLTVKPNPPFQSECASGSAPDPGLTLPAFPPTADATLPAGQSLAGNCKRFLPGHYGAKPVLAQHNYFASGVYYFDNVGSIGFSGDSFGGQPSPGETQTMSGVTPCSNDSGTGVTGTGVLFILAGNSTISVGNGDHLELFSRVGSESPSPNISIYHQWNGTTAETATVFSVGNGSQPDAFVHGLMYVPHGSLDLRSVNDSGAAFSGGLVGYDIALEQPNGNGLQIQIPITRGRRKVVIVSDAGPTGQKVVQARAVVTSQNNAAQTVDIASWWTRN